MLQWGVDWGIKCYWDNPPQATQSGKMEEGIFSVRMISECYLTSRYPLILPNNVGHRLKQPCVDLWSGLTISTHLCKCAWLGHCMIVTLLQVHNSLFFHLLWRVCLSCVKHFSFIFVFLQKINLDKITPDVHCHAYRIVCSDIFFLCVTSRCSKIFTVNDFQ